MPPTKMPASKKAETVEELVELIERSDLAILTEVRGVNTPDLRRLRLELRPTGATYRITKNTLLRLAAERLGREAVKPALSGPTAVAFVQGELGPPIRILSDFSRTSRNALTIKGGLLGKQFLSAGEINEVLDLPPKPQIIARLAGHVQAPMARAAHALQSPITQMAYALNYPLQALARVLQARADQLGGSGEAA